MRRIATVQCARERARTAFFSSRATASSAVCAQASRSARRWISTAVRQCFNARPGSRSCSASRPSASMDIGRCVPPLGELLRAEVLLRGPLPRRPRRLSPLGARILPARPREVGHRCAGKPDGNYLRERRPVHVRHEAHPRFFPPAGAPSERRLRSSSSPQAVPASAAGTMPRLGGPRGGVLLVSAAQLSQSPKGRQPTAFRKFVGWNHCAHRSRKRGPPHEQSQKPLALPERSTFVRTSSLAGQAPAT